MDKETKKHLSSALVLFAPLFGEGDEQVITSWWNGWRLKWRTRRS